MFGIFDVLRRLVASLNKTADLIDQANERLTHLLGGGPVDVTPPLPPPTQTQTEANGHTEEPVTAGGRKPRK